MEENKMKKIITILYILLILPLTSMALEPISDQEMADQPAQAGVSITFERELDLVIEKVEYKDTDGYAGSNAGVIGFGQIHIHLGLQEL